MDSTDLSWRDLRISADEARYDARLEILAAIKKIRSEATYHGRSMDYIAGLGAAIDAVRDSLRLS